MVPKGGSQGGAKGVKEVRAKEGAKRGVKEGGAKGVSKGVPKDGGAKVDISFSAMSLEDDSGLSAAKRALSLMTIYLAAIIHDFEHKGVNNQFLVQTGDPLALLYNDVSPMENHHIAAAFSVLKDRDCNFLEKLPKRIFATLRAQVIEMVLGTDMKLHFSLVSQFQNTVTPIMAPSGLEAKSEGLLNLDRPSSEWARKSTGSTRDSSHQSDPDPSLLPPAVHPVHPELVGETMQLVWKIAMKCADLCNLANAPPVARKWVHLLGEEMFRQGDQEIMCGLSISPLMDRKKASVAKSQPGFFNVVAIPLFSTFVQSFPQASPMLEGANNLLAMWVAEGEEKQASVHC
eukprot:gene16254-22430_t